MFKTKVHRKSSVKKRRERPSKKIVSRFRKIFSFLFFSVWKSFFSSWANFLVPVVQSGRASRLGERLSKSKIIPNQARAFANALKEAFVRPLRKNLIKRKSSETRMNDNKFDRNLSRSSLPNELISSELSVDSNDSTTTRTSTPPPPPKPARRFDDSESESDSIDVTVLPPAKPPRLYSVYKREHHPDLIQQTDEIVKRVLRLVRTFDSPTNDENSIPNEIIQFASNVTNRILEDLPNCLMLENSNQQKKSIVTLRVSSSHNETFRPSMKVTLDSTSICPIVKTTVQVTSSTPIIVKSTSKVTSFDDRTTTSLFDNQFHQTSFPFSTSTQTRNSSVSTIYESLENSPSSTSQSYATAVSRFDQSDSTTPSLSSDSEMTENDGFDPFHFDRTSRGRFSEKLRPECALPTPISFTRIYLPHGIHSSFCFSLLLSIRKGNLTRKKPPISPRRSFFLLSSKLVRWDEHVDPSNDVFFTLKPLDNLCLLLFEPFSLEKWRNSMHWERSRHDSWLF